MKCERCGKELSDIDLYCSRCGKAVFPEYMDEEDIWAYYKSDEELEQILKAEKEQDGASQKNASDGETSEPEEKERISEQEDSEDGVSEIKSAKAEESESKAFEPEEAAVKDSETENIEQENSERENSALSPENGLLEEDFQAEDFEREISEEETSQEEVSGEDFPSGELTEEAGLEEQSFVQEIESPEDKVSSSDEGDLPEETLESQETTELESESDFDEEEDEDEDEEEEEEKEPLTPEKKRARRYTALLAGFFLLLCLAAGIILGIRRMNHLETLEREYTQKLEDRTETEPTAADTGNIRLLSEEADLSQYTKLQPASAQADSQKQSEEEDYSGSRLIDGDPATSWQEGEEGTGEGKGVTLTLDGSHQIRYLALYLGNWKSDELWNYNARPQSLAVQVGEGEEEVLEFPDEKKVFYLALQEPVEASEIKIRIQSSYEGERWEDNCISEIEVYE